MNSTDRLHLSVTIPIIVACAIYFIDPPAPRYFPVEGIWSMEAVDGSPSMGWYGRTAWAMGGWLIALATIRTFLPSPNGHQVIRLATATATGACVLSLFALSIHIIWHEITRLPG